MTDTNQQQQPTQQQQQQPTESGPPLFAPLPTDVAQLGTRGGFAFGGAVYRAEGGLTWPEYRRYVQEQDQIDADRAALEAAGTLDRAAVRELQAREIGLAYRTVAPVLARGNRDLPLTVEYLESAVSPMFALVVLSHFLLQCDPFRGSALPPLSNSAPSTGQPVKGTSDDAA